MTTPTPTTPAGLALLRGLKCPPYEHTGIAPSLREVVAIEAEAAAAARTELAEQVRSLNPCRCSPAYETLGYERHALECVGKESMRNAVLAEINRRRP